MRRWLKALMVILPLITSAVLLSTNNFYGYDQFTADENNKGLSPRGALQHYADPNVPFILDSNPLNMGSRTAMDVIGTAFSTWNHVPTSNIGPTIAGTQDFTVSDMSGSLSIFENGVNEVVNVDTEEMADSLGLSEGVLGVGLISGWLGNGEIIEGTLFMVTAFGEGGSDYEATAVHELGHVVGLMHTPVTPMSTLKDESLVPTMYPFALSDDRLGRTLEPDDIASVSQAYPHPSFLTSFGTISGTVNDVQNKPVFGAVVFAMNIQTGAIICRFSGHNSGVNGDGEFVMRGLPPGQYLVGVERLLANSLGTDILEPGRFDDFYTQADSAFLDTFLPGNPSRPEAAVVNVAAGQTATANLVVQRNLIPQDDAFEDNDEASTARSIGPGGYNLNLLSGDEDWFKIKLEAGQSLRVLARFNQSSGDLDMFLFDPNGVLVAKSDFSIDDELVVIENASLAGDYRIRLVGYQGAANSYTLTVRGGSAGGGQTSTAELAYDGGTPTRAYYWRNAGQGSAVRFTPPHSPAKLLRAIIFIDSIVEGNQHNLRVLDASGTAGSPGRTIYGPVAFTVPVSGWIAYDLSNANISVSGDFYVMIEYNGTSKPSFASENTPPIEKRSWNFDGITWRRFDTEDYLIRAVVEFTTGVAARDGEAGVPERFELAQNYPNPFWSEATSRSAGNPETAIRYQLPARSHVELAVYDLTGRRVAMLESGPQTAGEHLVRWDGRNSEGIRVPSGIYFYRLVATPANGSAMTFTKKLTVMK